jgi:signal transduction histidine kinase/tetratricopeptide (TPR) repeat protein
MKHLLRKFEIQFTLLLFLILLLTASCKKDEHNSASINKIDLLFKKKKTAKTKNEEKLFLDTITTELSHYKNDSLTRLFYIKAAHSYYLLNENSKIDSLARRAYTMAVEANDSNIIAQSFYHKGLFHFEKNNVDSTYYYFSQAEKIYLKLKNKEYDLANIILFKSYVYYNISEYAMAETEGITALRMFSKDSIIDIFACYNILGSILDDLNNNAESIKYYKLALGEIDKLKNSGMPQRTVDTYISSCYNNMGGAYERMGNYNEAIHLYNEALKKKEVIKTQPSLHAKLLSNLGVAVFNKGDHEDAIKLYHKSLRIRDSLNDLPGIIPSHINIGKYYIAKQDTVQAISHLVYALDKAKTIQSNFDILNSLKLLAEIDKSKSAYYSGRYVTVTDSLQDIARKNRNKFARIEYETEKLEHEKLQLAKHNTAITAVFAIAILFVLALFAIYYLNSKNKRLQLEQQQQKANEEIYELMFEQQQKADDARTEEKNRIAMELHDGILNTIYAARLKLYSLDKNPDDTPEFIDKAYDKELHDLAQEIRLVSHELSRNSIINTDKDFGSLLNFMITSQKNSFRTKFTATIDPDIDWENMSNICKVNLYRIIQEALQNINKYSHAKHVTVSIHKEENSITLKITDDGIGFDTTKTTTGIGLKNLKKRTETLNGTISINSQPGEGAFINVVFPV